MHQSMKITIRRSESSFPTSLMMLVDSFVWLCCTRRQKQCKVKTEYGWDFIWWWNMYWGWSFSSGFWQCVVLYKRTTVSEERAACLDDRCNTLFQNIGAHPLNYTVSHQRRHYHKILKYERNWRHLRTKSSEEYCIYWIVSHASCGFSMSKNLTCFEFVSFMGVSIQLMHAQHLWHTLL